MKFSIKYQLSPRKEGDRLTENVPIRLRVSFAGLRVDIRSGYVIDAAKWDADNACVKVGSKNCYNQTAGEINRALTNLSAKIEEVLTLFELNNHRAPTVKEFKEAFDIAAGRDTKKMSEEENVVSFFDAYDLFTSEMGATNNWTRATYTKFSSLRFHLQNFRSNLSLIEFSKSDFADFVSYLQNEVKQLNTTVAKNVGFLRWFLRWASANGYYPGAAHLQFRPRFKGLNCKEVIYLSWEELHHFLTFSFPSDKPSFSNVRDVFCFCCFTGLRYSDVARLRRADVREEATPPYISIVTKKTTARLHIELNKYALALLEKYKDVGLPGDRVLPVISNVKMNEYLHEAAKFAGIDEPVRIVYYRGSRRIEEIVPKHSLLTTHCGRRTFIVNALRLGIPAPVIMEWTGHSNYSAMKPYIKIVNSAKAENMAKFDTFSEDP